MGDRVLESGFNGLARAMPSLPRDWYLDSGHHKRELAAIWQESWVYACHGSEIPDAGDFRVIPLAGQSVIVLRDRAGAVRAFHNTCRHRGSVLCTAEAGHLARPVLTCPYHAWSYGLDGRLIATGHMREVPGFDRAAHGLFPVGVAEWKGCIFLHLSENSADFAATHGPDLAALENWPVGDLRVGHRHRAVIGCNWKIFWENFNECLHCPGVHPELCDLVPIYGRAIMTRRDDPAWADNPDDPAPHRAGGLRAGAASWTGDGAAGPPLPGLTEAERAAGQTYGVVMPSFFVVGHVDYVRTVRILPLGPETTELVAEWLVPAGAEAPARMTEFAIRVMAQDGAACELNQRGLRARPFEQGTLMQEEYEVFLFQDWVRRRLGETPLGEAMPPRASRRKPA